jgi:hypothetical protein
MMRRGGNLVELWGRDKADILEYLEAKQNHYQNNPLKTSSP